MRFESPAERSVSPVERAEQKAAKIYESARIKEQQFSSDYSNIEKDLLKVNEAKRRQKENDEKDPYRKEAARLAHIFECLVYDVINDTRSQWLGEHFNVEMASLYDNNENHTDLIGTLQKTGEQGKHVALSMDITFGNPDHKVQEIKDEIDSGQLTRIKYFKSDEGKGLRKTPRIILGVGKANMDRLMKLWAGGNYAELEVDPARFILMEEARIQFRAYGEYATMRGMEDVATKFNELASGIESLQKNFPRRPKEDVFKQDPVYSGLVANVESKFTRETHSRAA
jgi:hypothetical protein